MKSTLAYPAVFTKEAKGIDVAFPDFPRAHTWADTEEGAYAMAVDCLRAAIEYALEEKDQIPTPSPVRKGQYAIPVSLDLAPKLALYEAMREEHISNVKLAEKLHVNETVVRRMLDPNHTSKPEQYTRALRALGRATQVSVIKVARSASA
jgi:antitoxin HicB